MNKLVLGMIALSMGLFAEAQGVESNSQVKENEIRQHMDKITAHEKVILYDWTIDDVYRLALEKNPTIRASLARVRAARYAVEEARSSYYPSIDLVGGYSHDNVASGYRHIGNDGTNFGIRAQWTIFDGFERKFTNKIAEIGHNLSQEAHLDGQRLLLEAVSSAFHAAALAQENMRIAKEDADFNELMLEEACVRREAGAVDDSHVWNYEINHGKAVANYINASKEWQIACIALAQLLALEDKEISDNLRLKMPENVAEVERPRLGEELAFAETNRPDLRSAQLAVAQAEASMEQSKASNLPIITAEAQYGWSRDDSYNYSKGHQNLSAGITARWNLFNGGQTTASIKRTAEEVVAAIEELENKQIAIDAELRNAFRIMEVSGAQMFIQKEIFDRSVLLRDHVKTLFYHGATTITQLNEAQTFLVTSSSSLSAARIQYLQSLENIKVISGRILDKVKAVEEQEETAGAEEAPVAEKVEVNEEAKETASEE